MQFNLQRSVASSKDEVYEVVFQIQRMRFFVGYHEMYRGQERDGQWKLLSNLARKVSDPTRTRQLEREMVIDFAKQLRAEGLEVRIGKEHQHGKHYEDWILLQQAQHFRMPTRIIDWTAKWEAGLYFAVANPINDDVDGQFWIYLVPEELYTSRTGVDPHAYFDIDPYSIDRPLFLSETTFWDKDFDRKMALGRRFRQYNRLCVQPYEAMMKPLEEQEFHSQNLFKIIIPARAKKDIREELAKENFNEDLFATGNDRIHEIVREIKKKYQV